MRRQRANQFPPNYPWRYNNRRRNRQRGGQSPSSKPKGWIAAAFILAAAGVGWIFADPQQQLAAVAFAKDVGVALGVVREREPQAGDYWRSCAQAKAAGTAPIHRGEPGYRQWLDADFDGVACEPHF